MIFSLSRSEEEFALRLDAPHLDIFCFFTVTASVSVPEMEWLSSVQASLRLKREVLLLEVPRVVLPDWNPSQRWQAGDNWSWLSPRALSSISRNDSFSSQGYREFKSFLTSCK